MFLLDIEVVNSAKIRIKVPRANINDLDNLIFELSLEIINKKPAQIASAK
tara:strand:- start:146 stop:295 length:150 start_codon:yes stop_codon:yes gene_type:complete